MPRHIRIEDNNFFELNIYGGYSDYKRLPAGLGGKIQARRHPGRPGNGELLELRGYRRKLQRLFVEQVQFPVESTERERGQQPFPIHTLQPAVDVVLHFTPRDHKFRPFVAVGAGASFDVLGKNAKKWGDAMPLGRRVWRL